MRFTWMVGIVTYACSTVSPAMPDSSAEGDAGKDVRRDVTQEAEPACAETKTCKDMSPSMDAACVASFDVRLLDPMGAPIAGEPVFFCGTNLCTAPLPSDSQGYVHADMCTWFVRGSLKYRGGGAHASFTSLAPLGPTPMFPPTTLVPLPATGLDFPGPSGGDLASSGAVLSVPANATIKFDPSEPTDRDHQKFRAVEVPAAKAPPLIDPILKLELFWALAPVNADIKPSPVLKVPNTKPWPANATLDVFLNGNDSYDLNPPVMWGAWEKVGTAHVTPDGQWIVTDGGIPLLGMVAFRLQ